MNGKELYEQISNFVNNFNHKNEDVANAFEKDHKTLQAETIGLCFTLIQKASTMYENGDYDDRNEYTFKLCNKIIKKINWFPL